MVTRLELDGFKTFRGFAVDLSPFQVIVGPNGAGKSNLFDALMLLSRLAGKDDLHAAFQALRGDAGELFSQLPEGGRAEEMYLAAEMLVDRRVRDSWGAESALKFTRLRYELRIERRRDARGLDRLRVKHESLRAMRVIHDSWLRSHAGPHPQPWRPPIKNGRSTPFISTDRSHEAIYLHQDGHQGRNVSVADRAERTVLSSVANTEFPHAFAAREEMRNWRVLQLNPAQLREPSPMVASSHVQADGANLATALARIALTSPEAFRGVTDDLARLIPAIAEVRVDENRALERYIVIARTLNGLELTSRVMSDGTLRMLALAALRNDLEHRGLLCFEEPENGVHPARLRRLLEVLRGLGTRFVRGEGDERPLRQILVNTHSPSLIRLLETPSEGGDEAPTELLYAHLTSLEGEPEGTGPQCTRMAPVHAGEQLHWDLNGPSPGAPLGLGQVVRALEVGD